MDKQDFSALRKSTIDLTTLQSVSQVFKPTREEIAGMINSITIAKKWSRPFLCELLGMTRLTLHRYEKMLCDCEPSHARLIWLFYTLDKTPEKAFSIIQMATWGKADGSICRARRLTPERKQEIIDEIQRWKRDGIRKTQAQIRDELGLSYVAAVRICKEQEYRYAKGRINRKAAIPEIFRPDSIWIHVDWRKPTKTIAEETDIDIRCVKRHKATFMQTPTAVLKRHLLACGADPKHFEPMLKTDWEQRRPYAGLRRLTPRPPKPATEVAPVPPPDNIPNNIPCA